jgi:hypothetical protein
MKLLVLTAAVWPSPEIAKQKAWIFLRSCEKFGIEPHMYGIGHPWTIYIDIKINKQLDYLKSLGQSYSHALYTDSQDAFFTAGLDEIVDKYKRLGSPPILTAAYTGLADSSAPAGFGEGRLRYPHVGGHLSEIPAIIDAFEHMLKLPNQTSDDSFSWRDAWLEGWFRPVIDSECEIFQVTDKDCEVAPLAHGPRLFNRATYMFPCILHLSGGYSSHENGKDDRLIPWARRLGIIE